MRDFIGFILFLLYDYYKTGTYRHIQYMAAINALTALLFFNLLVIIIILKINIASIIP